MNYWDPHTPYRAPEDFGNPFENDPLPDWITEEVLELHLKHVGPHSAREVSMYSNKANPAYPRHPGEVLDMAGLRRLIDGYDCGVAWCDRNIGMLLEAFEGQGVMDDLVVVLSADHAENLGELGIYAEHATADYANCRVPLIVRWPGGAKGVDQGLHYNLDLAPTLADMLGQEPCSDWDGRSFAPAIREGAACGRDYLVISQCAHVCQRGVRWGPWLYMRTYHDGFHLFPDDMLFNVEEDPHEQRDLAPSRPEVVREGAYLLQEWHQEMMRTSPSDVDPLWTVMREGGPLHARGHLKEYCKRLEATGRGHAVAELRRRHPYEFE